MTPTEGRVILTHTPESITVGRMDVEVSHQTASGIIIPKVSSTRDRYVEKKWGDKTVLVPKYSGTQFKYPGSDTVYTLIREEEIVAEV